MNDPVAPEAVVTSKAELPITKLSRLIRRVHMFTGLFLAPWMLMYALSTLVMTHHELVASFYPSKNPAWTPERELDYSRSFATNVSREEIAGQILGDLGLDGTHEVHGWRNGTPLVIDRRHAVKPQRITFDPSKSKITIEREEFRASTFLDRMHRRRGYNAYAIENSWGFTVDVAVISMVFWSLSGIWLWWEIKHTRRWGALAFGSGLGLFFLFMALI